MTDSYSSSPQPSPASPSGSNPFGPGPDLVPPPAHVVPTNVKPRSRSGRIVNVVLGLALVIAVAGVAFAVGRGTANASTASTNGRGGFNGQGFVGGGNFPGGGNGNGGNGGGNGGPGGFFGGGAGGITLQGTVSAVNGDSITLKTAAGAELTITTNGDTTYHQQAAATSSDVKPGSTVKVQVEGFRGGRFGGGGANASPAPSGAPQTTATDITVVP